MKNVLAISGLKWPGLQTSFNRSSLRCLHTSGALWAPPDPAGEVSSPWQGESFPLPRVTLAAAFGAVSVTLAALPGLDQPRTRRGGRPCPLRVSAVPGAALCTESKYTSGWVDTLLGQKQFCISKADEPND